MILRTLTVLFCFCSAAVSQKPSATPESLALDLYGSVSGPAGHSRDWDRFRALFAPQARLRFVAADAAIFSLSVDDYIRDYGPSFLKRGVREQEIGGVTRVYGRLAHRWSAYRYHWLDGSGESGRGAAGIQMVKGERGWRIVSLTYHLEAAETPLPVEWLGDKR